MIEVPDDAAIVAAVRDALPDVVGIWFYGSAAVGRAGPESDLDIGVLGPQAYDFQTMLDAVNGLIPVFHIDRIDLVDLRVAGETLRFMVTTEGRRLYAADQLACGLFETHALSMFADLYKSNRPIVDAMLVGA